MSRKSSGDALDIESQQESLLVDAGRNPRRRWRRAFLDLKANPIVISTANDTEIKAHAVEDQDVESQQPVLLADGKTLRRWWHSAYLIGKVLRFFSTADKTVMETQLGSAELSDTREPGPTHEFFIDVAPQTAEIDRMIREKDLTSLPAFGGVQRVAEDLNGIPGHEEAHNRRFIHFLGKSCSSSTILLLLILAILSAAFGIKEKGLRTGWYEGALTLGAVILIVMVHSVCEYRNESSHQLARNQPWQSKRTPVEKQLNKLSTTMQRISVVISIIITVVLFLWFNFKNEHENSGLPDLSAKPHSLKELLEAIKRVALGPSGMLNMLSLFTLLLVGIADGLPLAIAIAVTCWSKRMLGDKTLAQEPSSPIEMASATVIESCSGSTLRWNWHVVFTCREQPNLNG